MWHKNLSPNLKAFASTTIAPRLFAPTFRRQRALSILPVIALLIALAGVSYGGALFHGSRAGARFIPQKRIVMLRHNETAEGSRCTITSDSLLDDYSSYVEGERFLVRLPQAQLLRAHNDPKGRGFADMRVEENEEEVLISFRLQPGASVSVNQSFNRLEINFLTNDGLIESASAK